MAIRFQVTLKGVIIGYAVALGVLAIVLVFLGIWISYQNNSIDADKVTTKRLKVENPEKVTVGEMRQLANNKPLPPRATVFLGEDAKSIVFGIIDPLYFVDSNTGVDTNDGQTAENPLKSIQAALTKLSQAPHWSGQATVQILNSDFRETTDSEAELELEYSGSYESLSQRVKISGSPSWTNVEEVEVKSVDNGPGWTGVKTQGVIPDQSTFSFAIVQDTLYPALTYEDETMTTGLGIAGAFEVQPTFGDTIELVKPSTVLFVPKMLEVISNTSTVPIIFENLVFEPMSAESDLTVTGDGSVTFRDCMIHTISLDDTLKLEFTTSINHLTLKRVRVSTGLGDVPPNFKEWWRNTSLTTDMTNVALAKRLYCRVTSRVNAVSCFLGFSNNGLLNCSTSFTDYVLEDSAYFAGTDPSLFLLSGATVDFSRVRYSCESLGQLSQSSAATFFECDFSSVNGIFLYYSSQATMINPRGSLTKVGSVGNNSILTVIDAEAGCRGNVEIESVAITSAQLAWDVTAKVAWRGPAFPGPVANTADRHFVFVYSSSD